MIVPLVHTLLLGSTLFIAAAVTAPWFQRRQVRAIERALYAEAISMGFQAAAFASEFARRHNRGELFDDVFIARWRLSPPMIYPVSAGDLGLLPGDAMDRLGYFHSQLGEARRRLAGARVDGHIASPLRADGATAICRR